MSREQQCSQGDAVTRLRIARRYLAIAELAADESDPEALTVAAGNAVLAAVAASDAVCCVRLGIRHRGQDHTGAVELLQRVVPNGRALAQDLRDVLAHKDTAHYGARFMTVPRFTSVLRKATRLVDAADEVVPKR